MRSYVSEAPFGNFRTDAHPGGPGCGGTTPPLTCSPYTFTGHLYDQESGLYYFGARYYDPETGRFLSQDPVAGDALNPPSLHKYLYAYSSPMNYTDPWGEYALDEYGFEWDPAKKSTWQQTKNATAWLWDKDEAKRQEIRDYARMFTLTKKALGSKGAFIHNPEMQRQYSQFIEAISGKRVRDWAQKDRDGLVVLFHQAFGSSQPQDDFGKTVGFGSTAVGQALSEQGQMLQGAFDEAGNAPRMFGNWLGSFLPTEEIGEKIEKEWHNALRLDKYYRTRDQLGEGQASANFLTTYKADEQLERQADQQRIVNRVRLMAYLGSGQWQQDIPRQAMDDPEFAYQLFMDAGSLLLTEGLSAEGSFSRAARGREGLASLGDLSSLGKARPAGIVYRRWDLTGTLKDYYGQAISEGRYIARQAEEMRQYEKLGIEADFQFEIVERAHPGIALDLAEESWIRYGGGPTNKSNPFGGLANKRYQMNQKRYLDAGGFVPRPQVQK